MSISAMKQALEALEFAGDLIAPITENCQCQICLAHTALRQAIAEAEKQEQKTPLKVLGLTVFTENRLRNGRVYDVEALQAMTNRDILAIPDMGKKALKEVLEALNVYASDMSEKHVHESDKDTPIKQAEEAFESAKGKGWVGLTDEEREQVRSSAGYNQFMSAGEYAEAVQWATEAKLKEKNI